MKKTDVDEIIKSYYIPGTELYDIFMDHAEQVTKKSIEIARRVPHLNPDIPFIEEAAMLHDLGIFMTDSPSIHCTGSYPYVCHGYLGRELLEKRGLLRHGLVCERHTGAGITTENIIENALPLPCREMVPVSVEEEIICFADKFFSKRPKWAGREKDIEKILKEMKKLDRLSSSQHPQTERGCIDISNCNKSDSGRASHVERFAGWINKFLMQ